MAIAPLKERKIGGFKLSYLKCRAWSHDWDFGQTSRTLASITDGFHEVCRCTRCGSEKVTWVDWEGKPVQRWYEYPEDYTDVTALTRAEARLQLHKGV